MTSGNDDKKYTIKRISPGSIADMETLYAMVYGRIPDPGYYIQKFETSYTGIEYAGFLAYNEDQKPVASLCLVPCFISYEQKKILIAQLTDGMTDPTERKNGLFARLADEIIALAKQVGIQLIVGFPNQHTEPLLVKMGWQLTDRMDRFMIPLHHSLYAPFITILRGHKRMNQKEQQTQQLSVDGCTNSVLNDEFAGIERSGAYLLYKSITDTMVLETGIARAWIKTGRDLVIGDMTVTEDDFSEMIKVIRSVARKAHVRKIYFQCSPGTSLHKLFAQHYKALPSFGIVIKNMNAGINPEKIKFTFADIDIF